MGDIVEKNSLSLANLWSVLKGQEKQIEVEKLSLTERDIFLCILCPQEKINQLTSKIFLKIVAIQEQHYSVV